MVYRTVEVMIGRDERSKVGVEIYVESLAKSRQRRCFDKVCEQMNQNQVGCKRNHPERVIDRSRLNR